MRQSIEATVKEVFEHHDNIDIYLKDVYLESPILTSNMDLTEKNRKGAKSDKKVRYEMPIHLCLKEGDKILCGDVDIEYMNCFLTLIPTEIYDDLWVIRDNTLLAKLNARDLRLLSSVKRDY